MNNSIEIIGARIKSMRENSGFTQSNVANYLKVDQSLVSMVEKGKRALTSDMLDKLAALFGVQISAFEELDTRVKPLSFALRASEIGDGDLEAISAINRIALNCNFITQLLEGKRANG
ncbi:MAG: helix-turn-helix transcriptional regulator [Desulfitobacteriaceae bacterium]|nr:helix-turn-helix transcriptional regulator [Desulfitobacteriaceae bacterium]